MDNSPLGLLSCAVYVKAEFGLKIPQVRLVQGDANAENWWNANGLEKGQKESYC